ncbi:MAG: hypothetical protein V4591_01830, partial [Bdellovibrionota bacterium]
IFPSNCEFKNLLLRLKDVPFKTMGAGGGDCLWVLCSRKKLLEELNFASEDIAFAFEDIKEF